MKPLGGKAYGSIPHLPGSRKGPKDYGISDQQAALATVKARRGDRVIVTVKLDGSNVAIARLNGETVALVRAGHLATTSPYEMHQLFAHWVRTQTNRFDGLLDNSWISGEWLAQAHGTRYALTHEPFVAFDLSVGRAAKGGLRRVPFDEFHLAADRLCLPTPHVLSDGPAISVADVLPMLDVAHHGELDPVEGAVWRVETGGEFNFMAKFVREGKVDGCYLPKMTNGPDIWNWRP